MKMSFTSFKGLSLIVLFVFSITFQTLAQPNYPRNPGEAKLIYSDLIHFTEAYNELESNTDTLQVLKTLYFDQGSAGLKEFINRHQLTPELLKEALSANPDHYALLTGFLNDIEEIEGEFNTLMLNYGKVMPDAMYAPTYLLVGANRGIGQASMQGQLITLTRVADDRAKLEKLIVHELSHFQQAMTMGGQKYVSLYTSPDNMLGLCLREGGAEFITSLVLGEITQTKALDYLDKDEASLKEKFIMDLETQNKEYWLWASLEQKSHPKLMGYAMGYKICDHYYKEASDKSQALKNILMMENADSFLKSSGYFDHQ
jgi:hypothetical protein